MSIFNEHRDDILELMAMDHEAALDAIDIAIEQVVDHLINHQPFQLTQFLKRELIDMLKLADENGNEYAALFPYQNLYLDDARTSKTPKDFRLYYNEETDRYESYTTTPITNEHGCVTGYEKQTVAKLNLGQVFACIITGFGIDPCGENKVAIYLKPIKSAFDHMDIQMSKGGLDNDLT